MDLLHVLLCAWGALQAAVRAAPSKQGVDMATVIGELDVMLFRDGKIRSGLSVTAPDVRVDDGVLNVRLESSVNEPRIDGCL